MLERVTEIKAELMFIDKHKDILAEEMKILNDLALEKNHKEEILLKENKDVENLEKMSLKSLFYLILGNKEQQLEKEKQEALKASLEYQRIVNDYNIKSEDVRRLKERLEKEESLIKELEELQLKIHIDNKEILEYRNQITLYQSRIKEIKEAIQAGEGALLGLESVRTFLDEANTWSTFDMFGGGFITGVMKHDKFEKAQSYLSITKNRIKKFEKELKDVYIQDIQIPSFETSDYVLDFMFDSFFTDMMIQSKISDALKNVKTTIHQIEEIMDQLYNETREVQENLNKTSHLLKDLIQTL